MKLASLFCQLFIFVNLISQILSHTVGVRHRILFIGKCKKALMLLAMHWTDWFWIWITARLPTLFIYQFWKGRKQKKGNFITSSFIIRQTSSRTKWHHSFLVLFATEQLLPHFCVSSPYKYFTYDILFLQTEAKL